MNRPLAAVLVALGLLAGPASSADVKNPDTYTYLTISDADSLDPAWSYDTASHMLMLNIYEPLFAYDGSSTANLVARVAAKVPTRANGGISKDGKTYRIPLRNGIKFQDGSPLTPDDVRYSIIRYLLYDRDAGPSSLLLQPLVGYSSTRDEKGVLNEGAYKDAAKAVTVEGDTLVLKLPSPFAPLLTVLAQWSPIVSKAWSAKNGGWDGTEATWKSFNNPKKESSPFFEGAMGAGPFSLERWDRKTKEVVLARFDGYWRGPAKLKRVIIKGVNEFGTRKLMLQAGDADSIYATAPEYNQLNGLPGVQLIDDLPMIEMNPVAFFTFNINAVGNNNIRSGKLDGDGIPPDFFADKDVRKGFAHSFDYLGFIKDVKRGKGTQATGCIPLSLPGHNAKGRVHTFDLALAKEHFQKAMGGKVWEKGFHFTLAHNSGNVERETFCRILKRSVESLNPKFKIDVRPVEWPTFLDNYKASKLPIFVMGWQADFPDAHNFAFPLMHSKGDYPFTQRYSNPAADKLVDAAIAETDPAKRVKIYHKLQELEFDDVPHLVVVDAMRFRTQRDWVKGFVHNPVFPDSPYGTYFYTIQKAARPAGTPGR